MNIKKLEPFAWGYINAGRENKSFRVANGMKTFAEEVDAVINTEEWFQSPRDSFGSLAVHYSRSDGIVLREKVKDKNEEALSELSDIEELDFYYDFFRPYETTRIIS